MRIGEEKQMRCLVVEDEAEIANFIKRLLEELNGVVDVVSKIVDAKSAFQSFAYDLVILDRGLPDGDALTLLEYLNVLEHRPGVLVLTAMDAKGDVVAGLNAGADDYLVKPFEPQELAARIRVILRRPRSQQLRTLRLGNVELNLDTNQVVVGEREVVLRRREAIILETLLLRHDRIVSRNALIEAVYGFDDEIESNSLEAQLSRLRKKLSNAGSHCEIRSMRGIGYIFRCVDIRS
jgi:two-component system, OmpR family, response regulator